MTADIEQSDREMAAWVAAEANPEMPEIQEAHRKGWGDESPLVEALACHRQAERAAIVAWLRLEAERLRLCKLAAATELSQAHFRAGQFDFLFAAAAIEHGEHRPESRSPTG